MYYFPVNFLCFSQILENIFQFMFHDIVKYKK